MKKKTVTIIVLVLILIAAVSAYLLRPASPSAKANASVNGLNVEVKYSSPYKKGRVIFGEKTQGALQPFGEYWRLGANAATEITFSKDATFGGKPVKSGTYRMYAVLGENVWQITLNSELGKSGSELPNHSMDVLTIEAEAKKVDTESEQFIINLEEAGSEMIMKFRWDHTEVGVPIQ